MQMRAEAACICHHGDAEVHVMLTHVWEHRPSLEPRRHHRLVRVQGSRTPACGRGCTAQGGHSGEQTQTSSQHTTAPWCLPKGPEHSHPHERLGTDVNSTFTTAKSWKRPRCPQQVERQSKMDLDNGVFLVLKRNMWAGWEKARRHLGSRDEEAAGTGPQLWVALEEAQHRWQSTSLQEAAPQTRVPVHCASPHGAAPQQHSPDVHIGSGCGGVSAQTCPRLNRSTVLGRDDAGGGAKGTKGVSAPSSRFYRERTLL